MTGLHPATFWASNLVWDFLSSNINIIIIQPGLILSLSKVLTSSIIILLSYYHHYWSGTCCSSSSPPWRCSPWSSPSTSTAPSPPTTPGQLSCSSWCREMQIRIQICSRGKRARLIAETKVLLGICGTPFSYAFSFLANNPASGLISLLIVSIAITANTLIFFHWSQLPTTLPPPPSLLSSSRTLKVCVPHHREHLGGVHSAHCGVHVEVLP